MLRLIYLLLLQYKYAGLIKKLAIELFTNGQEYIKCFLYIK